MTFRWWAEPTAGEIVWCHFPDDINPRPKPRLALILAVMGAGAIDVLLAWAYVVTRIVHSIWQATVNRIPVRFTLFFISTLFLLILAVRAVMATLLHNPATITG